MRRLTALAALLVICAPAAAGPQKFPDMTFDYRGPYVFDVSKIQVVSEYKAPEDPTHIEKQLPVSLEDAVRNYTRDRFKRGNITGPISPGLRVIIHDASATEIEGEVVLALDVSVQVVNRKEQDMRTVRASGSRSRMEPRDQTPEQREQILYDLTRDLVKDLDSEFSNSIPTYMRAFITSGLSEAPDDPSLKNCPGKRHC